MSSFTGFINFKNYISFPENIEILKKTTNALTHLDTYEEDFFTSDCVNFGYKRLKSQGKQEEKQILTLSYGDNTYTIIYNGKLYNSKDIQKDLMCSGFEFDNCFEPEIILKAFIHYGTYIFKEFNGVFSFAIWDENRKELILVRDHFGIKPLFYTFLDDTLVFSSEIKSILKFPGVETILDRQGICELLGIGPAHTPGTCVFSNISEVKPAHYSIFNKDGVKDFIYWEMKTNNHTDNFEETCNNVRFLLEDSIKRQLVSDVPLCAMLSGGIDSSILVAYASKYYKENGMEPLKTLSVDYVDNDKNFIKSDFQPNSDNYYIDIMKNTFNTEHQSIIIDTPELIGTLEDAMIARDFPGMADVDSSMLLFCKNIKNYASIALSGECSDEIFAGYPWFFREDALNSQTFPWSLAISERQNLLNEDINKKVDLKEYTDFRYAQSISNVKFADTDTDETKQKRIISYLTINWFMQTLIDRADRMSMKNNLELRVPFCDYRLVQYMWNVPWDMKAYSGREKGLLRHIVKDLLPYEIVNRKKSPYPKTHNPNYLKAVKELLSKIMNNSNAPINNLLNRKYILNILETDAKAFARPWFGQLMTGPQLIAYLSQVNMWLEEYKPEIKI